MEVVAKLVRGDDRYYFFVLLLHQVGMLCQKPVESSSSAITKCYVSMRWGSLKELETHQLHNRSIPDGQKEICFKYTRTSL